MTVTLVDNVLITRLLLQATTVRLHKDNSRYDGWAGSGLRIADANESILNKMGLF